MAKKILFILPTLTQTNGVAAFIENYLRFMNLDELEIQVICNDLRPSKERVDFYKSKNIKVNYLPYIRTTKITNYLGHIDKFFKENRFDLIYSNVAYQSIFFFYCARKYGMSNFALHSHASEGSDNKLKRFVSIVLQALSNRMVNKRFACSELAGRAMFEDKPFEVINNAIDYHKYAFSQENRSEVRNSLGIGDSERIIGFVGRYVLQKNVFFFLDLAEKIDENTKILMIGTGDLKEKFDAMVNEKQLNKKFIFISECNDVYRYYSAMDVFMLPSLFEGLPVTAVEAQANGLPCLLSDTITKECRILDTTFFLNRENCDVWIKKLSEVNRCDSHMLNDNFDIKAQAIRFRKILDKVDHSGNAI